MALLSDEAALEEIVKLVGMDALSAPDRLKMETARSIREDFLHQLAYHEVDTYTTLKKQNYLMKLIIEYYDRALEALSAGADIEELASLPVRESIGRFKYVRQEDIDIELEKIQQQLVREIANSVNKREEQ